jgi:hypothetical protein
MSKKKNIPASNQNLINSQDGAMNSANGFTKTQTVNPNITNDFLTKENSAMQPGIQSIKDKK